MKVIKSLETRGILLKGTSIKITCQKGGFPNFLKPLMTAGLPLMKNVLTPLAKTVLILLGLTASATNTAIQKKTHGSTALIIPNKEMKDIMKIVKSLEQSGLLIRDIRETIKNKAKEQKGGFLGMLLGILVVSVLGNMSTEQGIIKAGDRLELVKIFNAASSSN